MGSAALAWLSYGFNVMQWIKLSLRAILIIALVVGMIEGVVINLSITGEKEAALVALLIVTVAARFLEASFRRT